MKSNWTDFEDEAKQGSPRRYRCKTCTLLDDLPEEASRKLKAALDNAGIASSAIRRALMSRIDQSMIPSAWMINYHRRGECRGR